jgi:hypothetical protein
MDSYLDQRHRLIDDLAVAEAALADFRAARELAAPAR